MKHQFKGFISGIIVATLVLTLGIPALAATVRQLNASYSGIQITLDGKKIEPKDANGAAVEPFTVDGTTYLPLRAMANALGLTVEWDGKTQTVKLGTGGVDTAAGYGRKNPAPVGTAQTISVKSYSGDYKAKITVSESVRGDSAMNKLREANQFNKEAPDGKEYVLVKISADIITVSGDKAVNISDFDFRPYSSKNSEYAYASVVEPKPELSGSAFAGGTVTGYATYMIDKDDMAPKIVFGADYSGAGGIWFSLV